MAYIKSNFNPYEFADAFRQRHHYMFIQSEDTVIIEKMMFYDEAKGKYDFICRNHFKGIIKQELGRDPEKLSQLDTIYKDLTVEVPGSPRMIDMNEINADERYINFANGIYDMAHDTILPHSPEYHYTIQIPCCYDPTEKPKCPKVLSDFLLHCFDGDKEQIALLFEYYGLGMSNMNAAKFKKSLFIVGEGNTGKSVLRDLIIHLIGENNCDNTDLETLNSRFGPASLFQKRIGGCSDMSFSKITQLHNFKLAVGGDPMTVENKGEKAFQMRFKGLLIYCTNALPQFGGDLGNQVFDRMTIMRTVGQTYAPGTPPPSPKALPRNPHLLNELLEEDCKKFIVYRAMQALKGFIQNGCQFHTTAKNEQYLNEYISTMRSVEYFLKDCCENKGTSINKKHYSTAEIYRTYETWCLISNPVKQVFTKKEFVEQLTICGMAEHRKIDGYPCYTRFTLTESADLAYKPTAIK